jgi:hypothetical protein
MVVCSFQGDGEVKPPTNLLTVLSAVNRHTAYMDSFVDQCHTLMGPVEKEHFGEFGFGLIFCGGFGL